MFAKPSINPGIDIGDWSEFALTNVQYKALEEAVRDVNGCLTEHGEFFGDYAKSVKKLAMCLRQFVAVIVDIGGASKLGRIRGAHHVVYNLLPWIVDPLIYPDPNPIADLQRLQEYIDRLLGSASCKQSAAEWNEVRRDLVSLGRLLLEALRPTGIPISKGLRPDVPTAEYCLLPGYKIRWNLALSPEPLQPQLYALLQAVLQAKNHAVSFEDLRESVFERSAHKNPIEDKTIQNKVSDLNKKLLAVGFPWTLSASNGHIQPNI